MNKVFKRLQVLSAATMAFAHGTSDAQKTMGLITMALLARGVIHSFTIPFWVILSCAVIMGLGTASGGWKIIKTMGMRVIKIDPIQGFSAETCAATSILLAAHLGMPVSPARMSSRRPLWAPVLRGEFPPCAGASRATLWAHGSSRYPAPPSSPVSSPSSCIDNIIC